ncbi:MAG: enoyl-CoA hydratase/isomerase family protein [Acidimicrobiia bacterium]|nr:enoyl-CoA hydratase/isomerase family protein [Acidimicrobiia bacterium]
MSEFVTWNLGGRVASIVLQRPERGNAITSQMLGSIASACDAITASGADVVLLRAEGPNFSVGFDLDEIEAGNTPDGAVAGARAVSALLDLGAVTVARLHGWVVGGGAALAAACDLRVGDPTVTIRIPEVPLGIPLGWGAMPLLVAEMGPSAAKDLVMTGRDMDAAEAHRRGLLTRLADAGGLDAEVERLIGQLLAAPVGPLRATKQQADAAAAVIRTGDDDAARLIHAVTSSGFREVFRRYLERVRGTQDRT